MLLEILMMYKWEDKTKKVKIGQWIFALEVQRKEQVEYSREKWMKKKTFDMGLWKWDRASQWKWKVTGVKMRGRVYREEASVTGRISPNRYHISILFSLFPSLPLWSSSHSALIQSIITAPWLVSFSSPICNSQSWHNNLGFLISI